MAPRRTGRISKKEKAKTAPEQTKKLITIRIESASIDYFKNLAEGSGISYQRLIDLFLGDAAKKKKMPRVKWTAVRSSRGSRKEKPIARTPRGRKPKKG